MKKDLVLAIDGSGLTAIAAIGGTNHEVFFSAGESSGGAITNVYSSVDRVLEISGYSMSMVAAVVVNTGPGSWSRTRIAVVYSCGLALGSSAKAFGMSGFDIASRTYPLSEKDEVAIIDQLGNSVFREVRDENVRSAEKENVLRIEMFPKIEPEPFLEEREGWLAEMIDFGIGELALGRKGDPTKLHSTYFQEFPTSTPKAGVKK